MKSHTPTAQRGTVINAQCAHWPFPTGVAPDATYASKTAKRWTDAELRTFAQLHVQGKAPAVIASSLTRTPKAILNQIGDALILKTPTGRKLAKFIDEHRATLQPKPANHRAPWDAAADNALIVAFTAGQSPAQIAKTCSRTIAAIAGRLHALGLLIFDKDTLTYSTAPKLWYKITP